MLGVVRDQADPQAVVGRIAVHLGREGAAGLSGALALLVEATGVRSAVLRRPGAGGELLAVAGDVVQALPLQRPAPALVELSLHDPYGVALASLTVTGSRPSALPVLRTAALVLGLAVPPEPDGQVDPASPAPAAGVPTAAALLTDAETDRATLADALHDGPVQELVAARWVADAALHTGDVLAVRDAVQTALVALRRTLSHLRPRGEDGLVDALEVLSGRLVEGGGEPLHLRLDPTADVLPPAAAVAVYRLVQSVATDLVGVVTVGLHRQDAPGGQHVVVVTVDGGTALPDAGRWRRTAAALGGDLLVGRGRLRLTLPAAAAAGHRTSAPAAPTSSPPVPVPAPTVKASL